MAVYELGYGLGAVSESSYHAYEIGYGLGTGRQSIDAIALAKYYPTVDINAATTAWTPVGSASFFATLDDGVTPNDADYSVRASPTTTVADYLIAKFGDVLAPSQLSNWTLSYRIWQTGNTDITVQLLEGAATVRAAWSHSPAPSTPTTFIRPLSGAEIAAIVDPTDLRIRVIAVP